MVPSSVEISVCLCTHNPRAEFLQRTLAALAGQTLAPARWELIVVDNRCDEPVAGRFDFAPFQNVRVIEEPRLGLTNARIAAIRAAAAPVLVFVDDDNVLQSDYLERALEIMTEKPFLGAIGGKLKGEFEAEPPRWALFYLPYLAVTDHGEHALYIHHRNTYLPWYPCGAGLVVRATLAAAYADQLEVEHERRKLDRRGDSLTSAGDIDMVLTSMDAGYAIGFFPQLRLRHLIPAVRLTYPYLKRMVYHANYSLYHLMLLRGIPFHPRPWPLTYVTGVLLCLLSGKWHPKTLLLACQAARGRYAALADHNARQKALQAERSKSSLGARI